MALSCLHEDQQQPLHARAIAVPTGDQQQLLLGPFLSPPRTMATASACQGLSCPHRGPATAYACQGLSCPHRGPATASSTALCCPHRGPITASARVRSCPHLHWSRPPTVCNLLGSVTIRIQDCRLRPMTHSLENKYFLYDQDLVLYSPYKNNRAKRSWKWHVCWIPESGMYVRYQKVACMLDTRKWHVC